MSPIQGCLPAACLKPSLLRQEEGNRRHYDSYLPDGLIDPPAEYGTHSYSPSRVEYAAQAEYAVQARAQSRADFNEAPPPSSPTRAEYDSDTYADALRRNSYACTIGKSSVKCSFNA